MKPGEEEKLKNKRGEIITHFSFLEGLIKKYISFHYFKTAYHDFVPEVLEDEYFNFGLLFRIFEKIIKKNEIEFPFNELRRLGKLRNIIAHAEVHGEATGFSKEEMTRIYFRHGGEEKEIDEILKEYDSIKMKVHNALREILKPGVDMRQLPETKSDILEK